MLRTTLTAVIAFLSILSMGQSVTLSGAEQGIKSQLKPIMKEFPIGAEISCAVVKGNKTHFVGLLRTKKGVATIDNKQTVFEVGSITKVFTAVLLARFVEEGQVTMDMTVRDNAPIDIKRKYTLIQLASHTSGLGQNAHNMMKGKWDYQNPYANYTDDDMREFFSSKYKPVGKPGEKYCYSNIGFGLLGFTLSRIDNIPYTDLAQTYILDKYGMKNSGFDLDSLRHRSVQPYDVLGKRSKYWSFVGSMAASDGLETTAEDMALFLKAHFDPGNTALLRCLQSQGDAGEGKKVALGWHILANKSGVYTCTGKTSGFTSTLLLNTNSKTGVIIMSNQAIESMDELAITLGG